MMVNKGNMPARDNDTGRALASATPGSMGENPGSGGNSGMALIHPQRHNLKNRFELLRTLGEGTYGKVKLACEKATGEQVAIKYVKKTKIRDEMDLKRIRREIRILSTLRHPHIINIRQVFEKKDRIVLVMDCALGGELYDHLNTHRHIPEPNTRRLFRQIASAVHYMHQNSIVHRDLKLENIILDSEGDVKIADFGLANYFSYDRTLDTFCGSPLYASPEIVNGKPYHGPEVDVWSLGVVLYTLAYGAMPFESSNLKVLRQQISDGLYAEPAQPCGAAGLIRHMLTVTPARRATVQDVLNHWWVNLGHELTPDGQRYEPVPHPTGRTSHCSQSSFSCDSEVGGGIMPEERAESGGGEVGSGMPPPPPNGLHRVPGARSSKKFTSTAPAEVLYGSGSQESSLPVVGKEALNSIPSSAPISQPSEHGSAPAASLADNNANLEVGRVEESPIIYRGRTATVDNADHTHGAVDINFQCADSPQLDNAEPQHRNREAEGLDACVDKKNESTDDKVVSVFDSDRKPKRGILKRKGKFSGDDGGCFMMGEDLGYYKLSKEEGGNGTSIPTQPLPSLSSVVQLTMFHSGSHDLTPDSVSAKPASTDSGVSSSAVAASSSTPSPCPIHHSCVPITSSTVPSDPASAGGSGTDGAHHSTSRPSQLKSLGDPPPSDPSDGSCNPPQTSASYSSAIPTPDIPPLDAVCTCTVDTDPTKVVRRRKGILKNSANRNSLLDDTRKRLSVSSLSSNSSMDFLDLSYDSCDGDVCLTRCRSSSTGVGSSFSLPMEAGDRNSFCLDGEFTALSLEGMAGGLYPAPPSPFEDSVMDYSEARQVVQQAFALISNNQN